MIEVRMSHWTITNVVLGIYEMVRLIEMYLNYMYIRNNNNNIKDIIDKLS
jgi:hypothetical protein